MSSGLKQKSLPQSTREPESASPGPQSTGSSRFPSQDLYGNEFLQSMLPSVAPHASTSAASRMEPDVHPAEQPVTPVEQRRPGGQVGLIVRGKRTEEHRPSALDTHADVMLSSGQPAGYFGQNSSDNSQIQDWGIGMPGRVGGPDWWESEDSDVDGTPDRLAYVDGEVAREWDWPSTICKLNVSPEQAEAFDHYWVALSREQDDFSIAGDNCSTHAAEAFEAAGLIPGGIPGFDTPDALYDELKRIHGEALNCQSGYIDFRDNGDGTWSHAAVD
jgi:hypothetical protein